MKHFKYLVIAAIGVSLGFASLSHARTSVEDNEKGEVKISGSVSTKGLSPLEYPKKAKISSTQALSEATKQLSGKVTSASLESEDGYLIYAIEILNPDSGLHEILVDAGDGKILVSQKKDTRHKESDTDEEDGDDD